MIIPAKLPVPNQHKMWQTMDSTKLQSFCACPRSYFYEYVLGWRTDNPSNHLIFGQAWHNALEHIYREGLKYTSINEAIEKFMATYRPVFPEETDSWFGGKTPENAIQAMLEYVQTYATDAYKYSVIDTEVGGQVAIGNNRYLTVKLDLICQDNDNGEILAIEHKTGSQAGQTWERQWSLSIQIGAYLHALNTYYKENNDSLILVNGTFFYKTKRSFLRVPCKRTDVAMLNWLNTVNALYSRIEYEFDILSRCSDSDGYLKAFPMQPTACTNYAGCQFHDLCTCVGNPLQLVGNTPPSGFVEFWWNPLEDIEKKFEGVDNA